MVPPRRQTCRSGSWVFASRAGRASEIRGSTADCSSASSLDAPEASGRLIRAEAELLDLGDPTPSAPGVMCACPRRGRARGSDLGDLVTYDARTAEAGRSLGTAVVAPA